MFLIKLEFIVIDVLKIMLEVTYHLFVEILYVGGVISPY
jgi:hypothetical protein